MIHKTIIISLILSVFFCFSFCFAAIENQAQPSLSSVSALIASCETCHGSNGNSTLPIYPKLAGQQAKYFIQQMHAFAQGKTGPRYNPIMETIAKNLSSQQINALALYFSEQKIIIGQTDPVYLKLGQRIYQAGIRDEKIAACAACHGPTGSGNPEAPFPALTGQQADYIVQQLEAYKKGSRKSNLNDIMTLIAKPLSTEQMKAVASYIAGLH